MFNRVKQFVRAIIAVPPSDDEMAEIEKMIPESAVDKFLQLTVADQRHSLNVLYTARKIAKQYDDCIDVELLQRCAILHDIGRGGNMTTMKKTLAVLMNKFIHKWSVARGAEQRGFMGEMLYRYYHHGEISANMLRQICMEREADVVELHHVPSEKLMIMAANGNKAAASKELEILILADSLN